MIPPQVVSVYDQPLSAIAGHRTPRLFLPLVPVSMRRPTRLPPDPSVCPDCFYTVTQRSLRCPTPTLGLRMLLRLRCHRQALVMLILLQATAFVGELLPPELQCFICDSPKHSGKGPILLDFLGSLLQGFPSLVSFGVSSPLFGDVFAVWSRHPSPGCSLHFAGIVVKSSAYHNSAYCRSIFPEVS